MGVKIAVAAVMILVPLLISGVLQFDIYRQYSCSEELGFIEVGLMPWFQNAPHPPLGRGVQFYDNGISVGGGFKGFGGDYENAEAVIAFPYAGAPEGKLKVTGEGFLLPWRETVPVGMVQRACWTKIKDYVRRTAQAKGRTVHIRESVGRSFDLPVYLQF
jgi:hypothetical protein